MQVEIARGAAICIILTILVQWFIMIPNSNQPGESHPVSNSSQRRFLMYPPPGSLGKFCSNFETFQEVQRVQLELAKSEILGFNTTSNSDKNQKLSFYLRYFGGYAVDIVDCFTKRISAIRYYQIWKNGNDNIRAHLTAFGNLYKNCTRAVCKTEDECTTQFMIGSLPSPNKPGDEVNDVTSHGFHQSGRHRLFSFTFIRDPIPRFISGFTEIEYRVKKSANRSYSFPMEASIGTDKRFTDFIDAILRSDGQFLKNQNFQASHIAPQIGTLNMAYQIEGKPIRLYRLENFDVEWSVLAYESNSPRLMEIYSSEQLAKHESSDDPFNSSASAKAFINHGYQSRSPHQRDGTLEDVIRLYYYKLLVYVGRYINNNFKFLQQPTPFNHLRSLHYLRALCRIYLVDFVCLDYQLPAHCSDMYDELNLDGFVKESRSQSP